MVGNLLARELASGYFFRSHGMKRWGYLFTNLIWIAAFIALESYVYSALMDKLAVYTGFNGAFYILLVFALFLLGVLFGVPVVSKVFFRKSKERIILGSRPVDKSAIVLTKLIYSYLKLCLYAFITYVPVSCVYGIKSDSGPVFYIFLAINFFILVFLNLCLSCLLAIPYNEVYQRLRKHGLIVFIATLALAFALAYLYSLLLNLFVNLIQNSSLDSLFTTARIESIKETSTGLYPVYPLIQMAYGNAISYHLVITIGLIGSFGLVCITPFVFYFFHYWKNPDVSSLFNWHLNPVIRTLTPTQALVKKELTLAFSRREGMFSYITLIAVEPFLVYLVVSAVNVIFSTGNLNYVKSLFPAIYVAVDTLLILLFLSVINTSSSISLDKEKTTLSLMKTFPVSASTQLLIKILVPYALSSLSYLVTVLVLAGLGEVSWAGFPLLLLAGLLALLVLDLSSLSSSLKVKGNGNLVSVFIGFFAPIIVVLIASLTAFIPASESYLDYVFYTIVIILEALVSIPFLYKFKSRTEKAFLAYTGGQRL